MADEGLDLMIVKVILHLLGVVTRFIRKQEDGSRGLVSGVQTCKESHLMEGFCADYGVFWLSHLLPEAV